ncbi:glucose-6-phosphate exchanger SLC37A2-like [Stegodyphus dumicola]|uniref:glucose-6-phosphate exchanger SLC37A2-like n=1 Tax=Stegodyphus dumicola TaxID=202533 RepID=UPI0015B2A895|nr:glucose-6-phosphate exchanger SLC37A2-like [Stegodyphus dumicola]
MDVEIEIGGIPYGIWWIRKILPKDKKRRLLLLRVFTLFLTYVVYVSFHVARRPITVVQLKITHSCNLTAYSEAWIKHFPENKASDWCQGTLFETSGKVIMGLIDVTFYGTYAFSMYFSGIIADCYNPRYFLTTGCILTGFFSMILGLADMWKIVSYYFLIMSLILMGASQSTGWPVVLSCASFWYSGKKRGLFFGIWNTHNYLGSVLGLYLAEIFIDDQWGWSFQLPGIIVTVMGLIVIFFLVTDPSDVNILDAEKENSLNRRGEGDVDIPPWLHSKPSIKFYDALHLPGVLEYSACLFFSRMAAYVFIFWLPIVIVHSRAMNISRSSYFSMAYVIGGTFGGILAGVLKDILRRSALICISFFLLSILVILFRILFSEVISVILDMGLQLLLGLMVEAPYILIITSVSADIGTHKLIRRGHRALSTVGAIIEGTGAVGATVSPLLIGLFLMRLKFIYVMYFTIVMELLACLCLIRMAYKDIHEERRRMSLVDYWNAPAFT